MFIHRGESFGSTGSVATTATKKPRVPDLVLNDADVGFSPLPCIQVTQVHDYDEFSEGHNSHQGQGLSVTPSSRRSSIGTTGDSKGLKACPSGRTSRRVSLIPGEALEQAHAVLDKLQRSRRGSGASQAGLLSREVSDEQPSLEQVLRTSLQQTQQMQLAAALQSRRSSYKESAAEESRDKKDLCIDEHRGKDRRASMFDMGDNAFMSVNRMKSNQRWQKLRTTVQLSAALSSSINRAKPALKREDSFIKRFSTRQTAEIQETIDQTDDEDVSKTSTGSPKFRRRRRKRNPITVINPYGNIFFYWLCILTICVLYNLWTAIVRETFTELQTGSQTMWYILDGITDFTYILDIFIQFRTGYLEQGLIVYNWKKLAANYLGSKYFLLDLAAVLPLDFIQFYSGMHPILRFPRFVKVYRVYNYYYMVESRTLYPNFLRVLNLVHILLLLAHWFGCFYYMLSEMEKFEGEWTYPYKYGDEFKTLSRKYLGSVYWSTLTLTTIGDLPTPESDRQYIFTIVSYLIGVFIFATIVGQVGNVITNRNANRLEFERLLDGAKLYMRHHKVPREMQRRVQRWYDYSWSR